MLPQCPQLQRTPLVICGPSGVGKGTLIAALNLQFPNTFGVSVSDTTRAPRANEVAGVHYNFITKGEFEAGIEDGRYIENLKFGDNLYGTSYDAVTNVDQKGLICLLEVHVNSAKYIKTKTALNCNYVFISVADGLTTLEERLRKRHSENENQIRRRLEAASEEFSFVEQNPDFFGAVIYNDDSIEDTLKKLVSQLAVWYPEDIVPPHSHSLRALLLIVAIVALQLMSLFFLA